MPPLTVARAIANAAEHYMGQGDAFEIANNLGGSDRCDLLDLAIVTESIERRVASFGLSCSSVPGCARAIVEAVQSLGGAR